MIGKGGQEIASLEAWREFGAPKSGDRQWRDGRSAKECAQAWLATLPAMPVEVAEVLSGHPDFGRCTGWSAEPEAHVPIDHLRGPPNIDVMVKARDKSGGFIVAVEAKAYESFGPTVGQRLARAEKYTVKNPRSKAVDRVLSLTERLLGQTSDEAADLRYQLLTAAAAALSEAERAGAPRAVLLIHEFVTKATTDARHSKNTADLDRFVDQMSGGKIGSVAAGQLVGPIRRKRWGPELYVGKAVRTSRGA